MNESECLKIGGHCWDNKNAIMTDSLGNAVVPVRFKRVCKHCDKTEFKTMDEMLKEER